MHRRRGSTIISVLVVMAVVAIYVGAAYNFTLSLRRNVDRSVQYRNALAVADGALQFAFGHWRQACRNANPLVPATDDLAGIPLPTADLFPSLADRVGDFSVSREPLVASTPATIANYRVRGLAANWAPAAAPTPSYGRSPDDLSVYYLATAQVTLPAANSGRTPLTVKLSEVFRKRCESPWNYAFFYTDYLDIHSGGTMTVRGPVHTMSDAYLGRSALTFTDQFSFGGALSIRPAGTGKHPGDPGGSDASPPVFPPNQPPRSDSGKTPFGVEAFQLSTADTNPDNDSYREVIEKRQGSIADDPFSANGELLRLYDRAHVRIEIDNANTVTIRNASDAVIGPASSGVDKDIYDVFTAALTTNEEIRDNRESTIVNVRLATLDVGLINSALRSSSGSNNSVVAGKLVGKAFNRIIYISDVSYDRAASRLRAVRLRNGAALPPGGLCIATENPLYIQGDYNTGRGNGVEPPSNNPVGRDPLQPGVGTYQWQPSVVYADAINLLSNSWTDANSFNVLTLRLPSNTTYNTSMVGGARLMIGSESGYSGGIENFPRFLENWNGTYAVTTYGTMVQLFLSKQATQTWLHGSPRYTSPIREFNFDERFAGAQPPGSFKLITYDRLAWSLNSF
jgi:hypothetical protein